MILFIVETHYLSKSIMVKSKCLPALLGAILIQSLPFAYSQSTAKARGTRIAIDLWDEGGYSCDNIESYRRTAERTLFQQCEDEFDINPRFVAACKDGVKEVITEKETPCIFDPEQCEKYGSSIGVGVAAQICEAPRRRKSSIVFSKRCIRISTNICIDVALDTIEDYLDENTCAGKTRVTRKMEDEVDSLCTSEVINFATIE